MDINIIFPAQQTSITSHHLSVNNILLSVHSEE